MAEPRPSETAPAAPLTDPQAAGAPGGTSAPKAQAGGTAAEASRPAAASMDELLAKEALASLKRSRVTARQEPVKFKPRMPIPAATLVVKPPQRQPWLTPFIVLGAFVSMSSLLSAGGIAYLLMRPATVMAASDSELRSLRETVAQLRRTVASLSTDVASNRTALDIANKQVSDRFGRLLQSVQSASANRIERIAEEKTQAARTAATTSSPEITGSVQPQRTNVARREVIVGWRVRRAFDGIAVLDGPLGVIEVARGQEIPSLGRIEEIKHENGSWQVLTSKGAILSTR